MNARRHQLLSVLLFASLAPAGVLAWIVCVGIDLVRGEPTSSEMDRRR